MGNSMQRVMISYSTKRCDTADRLHARLREHGAKPRLDRLDLSPAERWRESIAWWLSACDSAVVLLCPESIKSPWVRYELSVLANRVLVETNMRLLLVYLGGVTRASLHNQRAFKPCRLSELEDLEIADIEASDDDLNRIVRALAGQAAGATSPVDEHVGQAHAQLRGLSHYKLTKLRDRLPKRTNATNGPVGESAVGESAVGDGTVDDWDFTRIEPSTSEEEHRMRWAAARDFCAVPVERTRNAFQWLADAEEPLGQPGLDTLAKVGRRTALDSRAASLLHRVHTDAEPGVARAMVVGGTSPRTAEDVASDCYHRFNTQRPEPFEHPLLTGKDDVETADGIVDWFRDQIERRLHISMEEFLIDCAGSDFDEPTPVLVVLHEAEGVNSTIVERVAARLEPAVVLVLATAASSPTVIAERTGLPIGGLDLDADAWAMAVKAETARHVLFDDVRHGRISVGAQR